MKLQTYASNFIKNVFRHRSFYVNFAKFLRTPMLSSIYERLFLSRIVNKYENERTLADLSA